jgi:hypothetical protein
MSNELDLRTFEGRLEQACRWAGVSYSQQAIANLLTDVAPVRRQNVDAWMKGSSPKPDYLFALADKLRVSPRWLGTGKGDPKATDATPPLEEALAVKGLQDALPEWRLYVLGLATMDKNKQQLMLDTMREAYPVEKMQGDWTRPDKDQGNRDSTIESYSLVERSRQQYSSKRNKGQ